MTTQLYLIRHGEAVANVEPIIGGMRGDAGLTDRGREQAHLLEQRLRREKLRADQLYASTLPRAWETAGYVARALRLSVQPAEELHELRPGDADGMTVDQWRDRYGGAERLPPAGTRFAAFLPAAKAGRRSSSAPAPP
jgi:broad specificity phosphatase PhoE